jgi:hypothetical protein
LNFKQLFRDLLIMDVLGIFFERGPQRVIASVPHTGVGFVEAHGLALIFGVMLWRAAPTREWHLAAAAVHALLGAANLIFWQFFVAMDLLAAGYLTTALHWLFVGLQLFAATAAFKANDSHAGLAASS